MRKRLTVALVLALGIVVVIAVAVFGGRTAAVPVPTITLAAHAFQVKVPEPGVIQHPRTAAVPVQVAGALAELRVRPGDRVGAGEVIAVISNPQLAEQLSGDQAAYRESLARARAAREALATAPQLALQHLAQAEANLQNARIAYVRAQGAYEAGTGGDLAGAQAADIQAQANLSQARHERDADRELYAIQGLSRAALEQAEAKVAQTEAAARQARIALRVAEADAAHAKATSDDKLAAARNAYAQAQAAYEVAHAQARQPKTSDYDAAVAAAQESLAALEGVRRQTESLVVRAPTGGIVQSVATAPDDPTRTLMVGEQVSPETVIATIAGDAGYVVEVNVDEQDVANVHAGERASVTSEDFPGRTLAGHVESVAPMATKSQDPTNTSRQVLTTVRLEQTPALLHDGMSVNVDIVTTSLPHALTVPLDAVRREKEKPYVWVVRQGRLRRQSITLGPSGDVEQVVSFGLRAGDVVVARKVETAREGLAVAPRPSLSAHPSSPQA